MILYKCDECGDCGTSIQDLDGVKHKRISCALPTDEGLSNYQIKLAKEGRLAWLETCGIWRRMDDVQLGGFVKIETIPAVTVT